MNPRCLLGLLLLTPACAHNALPRLPDPVPDLSGTSPALAKVIQLRVAASNLHDWTTWEALHTEDCVRRAPDLEQPLSSARAMREAIARLGRAFPDYHLALIRVVGEGPWVAAGVRDPRPPGGDPADRHRLSPVLGGDDPL